MDNPVTQRCNDPVQCPVCLQSLSMISGCLKCPNNHSFDMAKEGYVNLLLSRKKLSATVGDSREMLQARRRFLDSGHFHPLVHAIVREIVAYLPTNTDLNQRVSIVDVGCGEGHYVNQLQAGCRQKLPDTLCCFYGVDVAKTAVRMAAKRVKNGRFFVSDIQNRLPFVDESMDILLNIFAPRNADEFARILTQGGLLLIVIPEPNHLQALRDKFGLLSIEPGKSEHIVSQMSAHFLLDKSRTVTFLLNLTQTAVSDLIQMTPSARHLTTNQQDAIDAVSFMKTVASFKLLAFIRR